MAVIAIIAVLAGILFSVFSEAKKKSYEARETEQLRQIYLAINLYEADNDHVSPTSVVDIVPVYAPKTTLDCPTDTRHALHLSTYPANPWTNFRTGDPDDDPLPLMRQRVPYLNSYAYLKAFQSRFPAGRTYDDFRNDPTVGLVTGLGLMSCVSNSSGSGCQYPPISIPNLRDPLIDEGQPAVNLAGPVLTIRTDGSIARRRRPSKQTSGSMSYEQLFLFSPL